MSGRRSWAVRAVAAAGVTGVVLALAGPATGSVQVGGSGWMWGNPLPQGNTINAMSFQGTAGVAVGDFGTVVTSTDGGSTWTGRKSGTSTDLTEVQVITPTSFFAGGGCVGRLSVDGGATFTRVAFTSVETSCSQGLAAAWFTSNTAGYLALLDGTFLTTADGGVTIGTRTPVPATPASGGSARPTDLLFLSPTLGLVSTSDGHVYRTVDGGLTWNSAASFGRGVTALTSGPGVGGTVYTAVGAQGLVRTSTDDGITWSVTDDVAIPGAPTLTSAACPAVALCMFTTLTPANAPSTTLIRWLKAAPPPADILEVTPSGAAITSVAFAALPRAIAAGDNGTMALSNTAGVTFTPLATPLTGTYAGVASGPGSTAFAYGAAGALAVSVDGGVTWTAHNAPTGSALIGASFTSALAGYVLALDGGLFRTTDGGISWRTLDIGTTTPANSVAAIGDTTVLVAGPSKTRVSTDSGESFVTIGALKKKKTGGINRLDVASDVVYAWGPTTMWVSDDDGDTWSRVLLPPKGTGCAYKAKCSGVSTSTVTFADMTSATQGWVVGSNARLYRTTNSGRVWKWMTALGSALVSDLAFATGTSGYVRLGGSFDQVKVRRTSDGGKTWSMQLVVPDVRDITTSLTGTDYLLGGSRQLLFTTTGGQAGATSTLTVTTSKTSLSKAKKITVNGTLSPAGVRLVELQFLAAGSTAWSVQAVKTASNGSFSAKVSVKKGTNYVVAQWAGDESRAGTGTKPLVVTVG